MKKILSILASMLMLAMVLVPTAGAQGADLTEETDKFKEMINSGYARVYVDMGSIMSGTPDASKPMGALVAIMEFKNADDAAKTFDEVSSEATKQLAEASPEAMPEEVKDLKLETVDGMGDKAIKVSAMADIMDMGQASQVSGYVVQKDKYIIVAASLGGSDGTLSRELAQYMADAKPSDTQVAFKEDGTSTGGVFDMMPTPETVPSLGSMAPMMDMNLMEMGTPVASPQA